MSQWRIAALDGRIFKFIPRIVAGWWWDVSRQCNRPIVPELSVIPKWDAWHEYAMWDAARRRNH